MGMVRVHLQHKHAHARKDGLAKIVSSKCVHPHDLVCVVVMGCVMRQQECVLATKASAVELAISQDAWLEHLSIAQATADAVAKNVIVLLVGLERHVRNKFVPWAA